MSEFVVSIGFCKGLNPSRCYDYTGSTWVRPLKQFVRAEAMIVISETHLEKTERLNSVVLV